MATELKEKYPFSVDSWTTIAKRKRHHFLTHAHSDHTGGIESFADRSIYCSDLTRRLVLRRFPKLYASCFIILEIDESKLIQDDEQPFTVTALDANHCPGAVMLLFEGDFGNVLHTGDCRLSEDCLRNVLGKFKAQLSLLDCVYMDCTFGKENLKMPSKNEASLQVRQCVLDHPQARVVYLASDMLGLEELWSDVAGYFKMKIYVDQNALPEYYADLKIVAPELVTDDPQSTRFHICEGSPFLYKRAKVKFMHARTMRLPEPLFIRPSAQYYTFGERLEGAGCGMILNGTFRRSAPERRHLRVPKAAERDEHGIFHVCYSLHSCRSELERALKILWPKEVISTNPGCHASEVMSQRVGLHHVDVTSSASARVRKIHQEEAWSRQDAGQTLNLGLSSEGLSSPPNSRARKKLSPGIFSSTNSRPRKMASSEEKLEKDYILDDFAMVVPLFGVARHKIPDSPPLSFASMDSQVFENSESSEECQEAHLGASIPGERKEQCPSGNCAVLLDCTNISVSVSTSAIPERIDDTAETLGRHNTESSQVTAPAKCKGFDLNKLVGKENMGISPSSDHTGGVIGFKETTRQIYRTFHVPIPSDLPSLLDLYYLS